MFRLLQILLNMFIWRVHIKNFPTMMYMWGEFGLDITLFELEM